MACVRKRRGKWVVDWRDRFGHRKWRTFGTRREAEQAKAKAIIDASKPGRPLVDPRKPFREYCEQRLEAALLTGRVKPQTILRYRSILDKHILPELGDVRLGNLGRAHVKGLLLRKLRDGLGRGSVKLILATASTMFAAAVADEVFSGNPLSRLGKELFGSKSYNAPKVKAFDRSQLTRFLSVVADTEPDYLPILTTLAWTGMRLSEALALSVNDVDLAAQTINVSKNLVRDGRLDTTKTDASIRTVDMATPLKVRSAKGFLYPGRDPIHRPLVGARSQFGKEEPA